MTGAPQSEAGLTVPRERLVWLRATLSKLDLLAPARLSGLEAAVGGVYLFALAFAVFGVHVARGSFAFDDWTIAYDVRHSLDAKGFFGAFNDMLTGDVLTGNVDGRPTVALHFVTEYAVFGQNMALHIASSVALAALAAFLFYVVLRWLGIERLHSGAIATLFVLFPAADSAVFYLTADVAHVTVVLYLAGVICALRGLRARGNATLALHALAIVLYVASILEYQIAAPFVLLSVLVYRLAGVPWRKAVALWVADGIIALAAVAYVKRHLDRKSGSVSDDFRHARNVAGGARQLLTTLGVQNGRVLFPTIAMVVLFFVAGAAALFPRTGDAIRGQLRRWLFVAGAGLVTIGVAYSIFFPADAYYWPLRLGIGNRVNAAAALGFALVIYALGVVVALLVSRALRVRAPVAAAAVIATIATVGLSAMYVSAIESDRQHYDRAASLQRHALDVVENNVPRPAPGTTVYLTGVEGEVAQNVFTFVRSNDLTAALRLLWDDDTIRGVPAASVAPDWPGNTKADSGISCGPDSLKPRGYLFTEYPPTPYGKALFIDVPTRTSTLIRTRTECWAAVSRYVGGT